MVAMAEEAAAADNNVQRDYWIGAVRGQDGTWRWQSWDPMDYTNWCANCPDREDFPFSQLLKLGYPGSLDTYYWARAWDGDSDNGVICEINFDK